MWLFDGSSTSVVTGGSFFSDLWHAFLVFLSMYLANHATGNTGANKQ